MTAKEFVKKESYWSGLPEPCAVILHTRAATSGKPENNDNNHPLCAGNYIGVHNGIIDNHDEIEKSLGFSSEVDSMSIWKAIECAPDCDTNLKRIAAGADMLSGSMSCAMFDRMEYGALYLFSGGSRSLSIGYSHELNLIVFASTTDVIYDATDKVFGRNHLSFPRFTVLSVGNSKTAYRFATDETKQEIPIKMKPYQPKIYSHVPPWQGDWFGNAYDITDYEGKAWNEEWFGRAGIYKRNEPVVDADMAKNWKRALRAVTSLFRSNNATSKSHVKIAMALLKNRCYSSGNTYHNSAFPDSVAPNNVGSPSSYRWVGVSRDGSVIPIWSPTDGMIFQDRLYNKVAYVAHHSDSVRIPTEYLNREWLDAETKRIAESIFVLGVD